MNITWHLRQDTQTCEWNFRLAEAEFHMTMALPEFFSLITQMNRTCQQIGVAMIGDMNVADAIAEAERLVKASQNQPKTTEKGRQLTTMQGTLIGELDKDYEVVDGQVVFDEVLLKGIWPPPGDEVVFNGIALKVESVASHVGMLVDEKGSRGPVLKGVSCKVV